MMKKIIISILMLLLTVFFTACGFSEFDGSRTGNENRLIMDYRTMNMTDSQELELAEGDRVHFEVVSLSGRVDIILQKNGKTSIYEGSDIPTSSFWIEVEDSGTYTVSVTGRNARGSVSAVKENSESNQEDKDKIEENAKDTITSEFDVELAGEKATFLVVEVTEDLEATAHYTYTTKDKDGASWGYYLDGNDDVTSFELCAGTENAYKSIWTDETIDLKDGVNIFYISGSDLSCKMYFELNGFDKSKVTYVSVFTKDEAMEKVE